MGLQQEIETRSAEISTDSYSMSVGELLSLYRDKEIDIHPEFQRFFRWSDSQKSRLIESMLLGIPLPPIFVAQRRDGVWDVVDGLQRISTILQFTGDLIGANHAAVPPLTLEATRYLPSLAGMTWESPEGSSCLSPAQRLYLKRVRLDVIIIKHDSDPRSKYELFQRLNTGGTPLSPQETRNCLLVMLNPSRFSWFSSLARHPSFISTTSLSDRNIEEQYDLELVLRFLALRDTSPEVASNIEDLSVFLDDKIIEMAEDQSFNEVVEEQIFKSTFDEVKRAAGEGAFKRYDANGDRFVGGFLVSAYEAVALGIGHNISAWPSPVDQSEILRRIKDVWNQPPFQPGQGAGRRASTRLRDILPMGRTHFRP